MIKETPFEDRIEFIKKNGFSITQSNDKCSCGSRLQKNVFNTGAVFPYQTECANCGLTIVTEQWPGEQI